MRRLILFALLCAGVGCKSRDTLRDNFLDPPMSFRPMPFWFLNGEMTREGTEQQITDARVLCGFGGTTPIAAGVLPHWIDGHPCPATQPEFLSEGYFERYKELLAISQEQGMEVVLYDDVDFPSGVAGGRLLARYPQYARKYLYKEEFAAPGNRTVEKTYTLKPTQQWVAITAMDQATRQTVDLQPYLANDCLRWDAPAGQWTVMAFLLERQPGEPHDMVVDYMDPEAVHKFMELTYDPYGKHFAPWFGNTIKKVFFDDVGYVNMEHTWTAAISERFRQKTGKNPALYYPAMFCDMGPETQAARVAFYQARAELLAEGYVKQITEWSNQRGLKTIGHPPSNYAPNTAVACGDILKYYRYADIPLMDIIFNYGHGRDGYKQITSAADRDDKGVVGAELYAAFPADIDSLTLYRTAIEAMARGANFLVPSGLYYDPTPDSVRVPPLIDASVPWAAALPNYSLFTARSCAMLQGGRRIVDVGLLWPIAAVQAESWLFRDATSGKEVTTWLPDGVNNYELSRILTDELWRDFTYVHPEDLTNGKITASGSELVLNNKVNRQNYKVLIMPGGGTLSVEALKAIKTYYDHGGKVIATSELPTRSAEFGRDAEVKALIESIFGGFPEEEVFVSNDRGGRFAYLSEVTAATLWSALKLMDVDADVRIDDWQSHGTENPFTPAIGCLNYLHKHKDGREIYYLINSTDAPFSATLSVRGRLENPEWWDPHTGTTVKITGVKHEKLPEGGYRSVLPLNLQPVSSAFIVAKNY